MKNILIVVIIFTVCSFGIAPSESISFKEFVTLNEKQKEALEKFKDRVVGRLPHDYMKKDVYLMRWLRDSHFDVRRAEKRLMENLDWRVRNKIDTITQEDWRDFQDDYKWYAEGCDKEGKPVASLNFGDWDLRRDVISGRGKRLLRYGDMVGEEASLMVRKMLESGQNATQAWLIMELKNFNLVQHACTNCIAIYLGILNTIQKHYPGYVHKFVLVNTPQYALPILDTIKGFMSKDMRDILYIFGTNKKRWRKELFKDIDPSQLTRNFGGTRREATDLEEIRRNDYLYRCPK